VAVDARNRYQATALLFSAWRGHADIVEYLLDRGADPRVADSFYGVSALNFAMEEGHLEIAVRLVEAGAAGIANVLLKSVEEGRAALVARLLKLDRLSVDLIRIALAEAREGEHAEVIELLAGPASKPDSYQRLGLGAEQLTRYTGTYHEPDRGWEVELTLEDQRLKVALSPRRTVHLAAEKDGKFIGLEDDDLSLVFPEGSGQPTTVALANGGPAFTFKAGARPERETDAETAETPADMEEGAAVVRAPRHEPINWAGFRGPQASGVADGQGIPVRWHAPEGTNIRWKTPLPGIATASPIIWGDRIFAVTAVSGSGDHSLKAGLYGDVASVEDVSTHRFMVFGLAKAGGNILWQQVVAEREPAIKRHTKATQANSTPVTDGQRVVSLFGTIGLMVCHDLDGKELWRKELGPMDSGWFFDKDVQWGHSSSPVIYRDRVILQVDVQKGSYIAAFRLRDGAELWKTARPDEIPTWGTPTIYFGETDVVATHGTRIRAYDPNDGGLLWHLGPNSEITVATPVLYNDLFLITAGYTPIRPVYAVKAQSRGDVSPGDAQATESVPWHHSNGGTYIPTPIVYRDLFYTCANNGRITAYRAATGERVYRARLSNRPSVSASPVAADGYLYFATESGSVHVVRAGPKFAEVAVNEMGEVMMATPAISDGVMVIRTRDHLYGIAEQQ
jgi:outer membrane protein assembly factor BamB